MNRRPISILIACGDLAEAEAIGRGLQTAGLDAELRVAGSLHQYSELVAAAPPDLAIIELHLPDGSAGSLLVSPPEAGPFPVLVLVPPGDLATAVALLQAGAMDCPIKSPAALAALPICVGRALREWDLRLAHRLDKPRLDQAQRFQESIASLADGIAHDLNNALAPISMTIELMRGTGGIEEPALRTIQTGAQRATDIVQQLVSFRNAGAGNRFRFQPRHLVKEIERLIRAVSPESIQVTSSCVKDLWLVTADPIQMQEVMLKLSLRAREAIPSGGRLTLKATNTELDAAAAGRLEGATPGRFVCLEIRHTGRSIPPAILRRIRNTDSSAQKPEECGVEHGLTTALGVVRSGGGFLAVDGAPDLGSVLQAFFPAGPGANACQPGVLAEGEIQADGQTVLVVDDEPLIRNTVTNVLRRLGFRSLSAADGVEALGICARHLADLHLVLTDLDLPHMSGLALLRTVRQMNSSLAMIVMAGCYSQEQRAELAALNVTAVLTKPFGQEVLLAALRQAIPAQTQSLSGLSNRAA